ncbi:hypothetical protein FOL47_008225 [Perkinsus chesapeaki]|uniref:Uncharacterized protein n=1 Tax=Perkinsus chesapeaki TaxID=330153 RepID=A0A7J6LFC3_PERCH|nr:hypothetical protein FOL47_008225 [Perkinsus chesapeaki]
MSPLSESSFTSGLENAPAPAQASALAVLRSSADTAGFRTPANDVIDVVLTTLRFSTATEFRTLRKEWNSPTIATLAKTVREWIVNPEDGNPINLAKAARGSDFHNQLVLSLTTMECEYEFSVPVITGIILVWLTLDDNSLGRRLRVRNAVQEWMRSKPQTSSSSNEVRSGTTPDTLSDELADPDFSKSPGYQQLTGDNWTLSWASLLQSVLSGILSAEDNAVDLPSLKDRWAKVSQGSSDIIHYLDAEASAYRSYCSALTSCGLSLPTDFDRVTNLVTNATPLVQEHISQWIRKESLLVHKISYVDIRDKLVDIHKKLSLRLPWETDPGSVPCSSAAPKVIYNSTNSSDASGRRNRRSKNRSSKSSNSSKDSKPGNPSPEPNPTRSTPCKFCSKRGHSEADCWYNPSNTSAAPLATSSGTTTPQPSSTSTGQDFQPVQPHPARPGVAQGKGKGKGKGGGKSSQHVATGTASTSNGKPSNGPQPTPAQSTSSSSSSNDDKSRPVTRSITGKLPAPSAHASTFALSYTAPCLTTVAPALPSFVSFCPLLGAKAILHEAIIDTASFYTLAGRDVLNIDGVNLIHGASAPSVSCFNGQSVQLHHKVNLPISVSSIDGGKSSFNIEAYICDTPMLRPGQLLFGLQSLAQMGATIDIGNSLLVLGDSGRRVSLSTASHSATACPLLRLPSPTSPTATLPDIMSSFEMPVANFQMDDHHPLIRPPRWTVDPSRRSALEGLLQEMISDGVIEPLAEADFHVTHVSRAFPVRKRSDAFRLVVDFRAVNRRVRTHDDDLSRYTDSVTAFLQSISASARFYATVDVSSAFHQISISRAAQLCCGLTDGAGNFFRFLRLPQGLRCSPAWWCYCIQYALSFFLGCDISQLPGKGYAVYMDDILVYGPDLRTCQERYDILLRLLHHLQLPVNSAKSQPPSSSVNICGMTLESGTWRMTSEHFNEVMALRENLPGTPAALRSALGVLQYNRILWTTDRPENSLSVLCAPFYELLAHYDSLGQGRSKRVKIRWDSDLPSRWSDIFTHGEERHLAIYRLGEPSDPDLVFVITTDASENGAAGCLFRVKRPPSPSDLTHEYLDNNAEVLDSWSERFTGSSLRWPIYDREAYAIVRSLERYKGVICGSLPPVRAGPPKPIELFDFAVLSDNSTAIQHWRDQAFPADGIRGRRWLSWADRIGPVYDYNVLWKHIAGSTNHLADMLSRTVDHLVPMSPTEHVFALSATAPEVASDDLIQDVLSNDEFIARVLELQHSDVDTEYCGVKLSAVHNYLLSQDTGNASQEDLAGEESSTSTTCFALVPQPQSEFDTVESLVRTNRFIISDSRLLYFRVPDKNDPSEFHLALYLPAGGDFRDFINLTYIPVDDASAASTNCAGNPPPPGLLSLRSFVCWLVHDVPVHIGRAKTYNDLRKYCWFPSISKFIKQYCKRCPDCAPVQLPSHVPTPPVARAVPSHRFSYLAIDHFDPRRPPVDGFTHVLTITDYATSYTVFSLVKDCSSVEAARAIYFDWISTFGWPLSIASDNATCFTSKIWKALGSLCGIKLPHSPVYHPQSNIAERRNRDLRRILDKFPDDRWDLLCKVAQQSLNFYTVSTDSPTPAQLTLGATDIRATPLGLFIPDPLRGGMATTSSDADVDQYNDLKKMVSTVTKRIDDWLTERVTSRTDERQRAVDIRAISAGLAAEVPSLQADQKVYWKRPDLNTLPATVVRCINKESGTYVISLDDSGSSTTIVTGDQLVPYSGVDYREPVLRTLSHISLNNISVGDIICCLCEDDPTRFYFAKYICPSAGMSLTTVQPLELQGSTLFSAGNVVSIDIKQINSEVQPFKLTRANRMPKADFVGGIEIGTCLGDLFSVNWMEDEDRHAQTRNGETLQAQYELIRKETNKSHVMQYGDRGFTQDPVDDFMGTSDGRGMRILGDNPSGRSKVIVESILGEFFGRRVHRQNPTEELQQEVMAERDRLREIKRTSSVPAPMIPIHIEYKKLKKEEGKPSNYARQLEVARRLLEVVQERVSEIYDFRHD